MAAVIAYSFVCKVRCLRSEGGGGIEGACDWRSTSFMYHPAFNLVKGIFDSTAVLHALFVYCARAL